MCKDIKPKFMDYTAVYIGDLLLINKALKSENRKLRNKIRFLRKALIFNTDLEVSKKILTDLNKIK